MEQSLHAKLTCYSTLMTGGTWFIPKDSICVMMERRHFRTLLKIPHSRCRWPPSSQANIRIGLCFRCTLHARSLHSLHCSPPQMSHLDTLKKEIPKEIPEDHQHLIGKQKESNKIILIWSGTKCRLSTHALFFLFWGFVFYCTYVTFQSELSPALSQDL